MPDYSILADALVASLNPVVMFNEHATISHLNEARVAIEMATAGQAARKRGCDDLMALHELFENFVNIASNPDSTRSEFVEADEKLHLGIARIAGNPVLYNILKALLALLRVQRVSTVQSNVVNTKTVETHSSIYEAIHTGNPDGAREAMRAHLVDMLHMIAEENS